MHTGHPGGQILVLVVHRLAHRGTEGPDDGPTGGGQGPGDEAFRIGLEWEGSRLQAGRTGQDAAQGGIQELANGIGHGYIQTGT